MQLLPFCFQNEPAFRSAIFNLGLLLTNNLNKPLEAVPYVKKLIEVRHVMLLY